MRSMPWTVRMGRTCSWTCGGSCSCPSTQLTRRTRGLSSLLVGEGRGCLGSKAAGWSHLRPGKRRLQSADPMIGSPVRMQCPCPSCHSTSSVAYSCPCGCNTGKGCVAQACCAGAQLTLCVCITPWAGNKETLGTLPKSKGLDIRQAVVDFHKK